MTQLLQKHFVGWEGSRVGSFVNPGFSNHRLLLVWWPQLLPMASSWLLAFLHAAGKLGGNCWRPHPLPSQLCLHTHALLWMALEVVAVGPTEWLNPKDFSWDSLRVVSWRELVGATPYFSVFNLSAPQSLRRHQAWPPGLPHYPFLRPALNLLISRRFPDLTG